MLREVFPCDQPTEAYLQDSVKKMFFELDTDENTAKRTEYIDRIVANIRTKD